jgi:hypothetical protein
VTTYLNYSGTYYEVDTMALPTSFTGTTGVVSSTFPIEITNPINYGSNSIYTLKFITENDIPANGFIRVKAPSQILIDINTTKALGTCATSKCTESTDKTQIIYLIPERSIKGTLITVQMGGLTNPRSF